MLKAPPNRILQVNQTFILGKCDYFVDVQLWPLTQHLNPRRWLSNFLPVEMDHAISLLNAFVYFNKCLMDQLLLGAFQDFSRLCCAGGESFFARQIEWRTFLDTVIITCVRGEEPNATDSGFTFLRMARQVLGIPENRILEPQQALAALLQRKPCPVVFLDDFVGSGRQFVATWKRVVRLDGHGDVSFELLASQMNKPQFFYCPLICTAYGRDCISQECHMVSLHPAHLLREEYSAFSPNSVIWPEELRSSASEFIHEASKRAGIDKWKGFHDLGLAIAFQHSVPDASLPILYWNANGWKPLIERT